MALKYLSLSNAATVLGVSLPTLNSWVSAGLAHTERQPDGSQALSTQEIERVAAEKNISLTGTSALSALWLEEQLTAAQASITSLQTALTTAQGNITTLQGDVTSLDTRVTALENPGP